MTTAAPETLDLQRAAREHLWLHFTRMGAYASSDVPIIVRGDGCYLEDMNGKRYLDALAGLFSVNIGYGFGEEIGGWFTRDPGRPDYFTHWGEAFRNAAAAKGLPVGDYPHSRPPQATLPEAAKEQIRKALENAGLPAGFHRLRAGTLSRAPLPTRRGFLLQ